MQKKIITIAILTLIGLVAGYLLFGKIGGEYLDISTIFSTSGGDFGSFTRKLGGIAKIRTNILISGGVGAVIGIVLMFVKKK